MIYYKGYFAYSSAGDELKRLVPLKFSTWDRLFGGMIVIPFGPIKIKPKLYPKFKKSFPGILGGIVCGKERNFFVIIQREKGEEVVIL